MTTNRINLDEVLLPAGVVVVRGVDYTVSHVTASAWEGAKKLQDDENRRKAGEKVIPDVDTVFRIARSLVPDMPDDVKGRLSIEQATAILQVACGLAEEVEALYPKSRAGA